MAKLHLIKLCVGVESVGHLEDWRRARAAAAAAKGETWRVMHVTRMWPRRAQELLAGGSLYWVIRGFVQARQRIIGFEAQEGSDGIRRCGILLAPDLVRTRAAPRRPFQGWRYLDPGDAPPDLPSGGASAELPEELARTLADIGLV